MASRSNDDSVFHASTIPAKMSTGEYPRSCEYGIDGNTRNKLYLFCNGIYRRAPLFIHRITNSSDDERYFASRQKTRRKDVEWAFGASKAKFHIVALPSCL